MKLVLLTGSGVEHRFVSYALADAFGSELAAIITAGDAPRSRRIRGWLRRYTLPQLASRIVARHYRRRHGLDAKRTATLERELFDGSPPAGHPPSVPHHHVPGHNHADCLALLDRIAPDAIVVYGTGIIGRRVMAKAGHGSVNMHTGLSPWYRGSDTIFWALHNREPERTGVTVHLLSEDVDAGAVLHTSTLPLEGSDDEDTLFAKAVRIGTPLLIRAARDVVEGTAMAVPQDLSVGREYRFVDRTAAAERRVRRLLQDGLLKGAR